MTQGLTVSRRAPHADHSLAVYLAPLFHGKRVAVVGPASGDVVRRCRALGAATSVSFGGHGDGIAVRPLVPGSLAGFQGRLDCIIVPDATTVPLAQVITEARRVLGSEGWIAIGTPAEGVAGAFEPRGSQASVAYHDLQDALAAEFGHVAMLGRGPFVAYAFARLEGEGEVGSALSLDTRMVAEDAAPAEAFVAIASESALRLDGVSLVQLPALDVMRGSPEAAAPPATSEKLQALEAELAARDAKVKEAEHASAERWVRIQRLEHELKGLDEEARKARDRAVKLTKELDDERRLRQRSELDAQMNKRGADLPRVDEAELTRAKEQLAHLERDVASARALAAKAEAHLVDLGRELDEAHAVEAELRGQIDRAEATPAPVAAPVSRTSDAELEQEFVRLERELHARGEEALKLGQQVRERDEAVRELSFALEAAQSTDVAQKWNTARERVAELSALNAGLASEASAIVQHNDLLQERLTQLESELAMRPSAGEDPGRAALEAELQAVRAERRAGVAELAAVQRQLDEAKVDLARQYALNVSLEDRSGQIAQELMGARAGAMHRVRELEHEIEQLVQALEVVGTHAHGEEDADARSRRDLDLGRAERNGLAFRLRDAEAALDAVSSRPVAPSPAPSASDRRTNSIEAIQSEQLLADLAETAARLATTEESLHEAREAQQAAEARIADVERMLDLARHEIEAHSPAPPGPSREAEPTEGSVSALRHEAAERELLVRSLVAQLEDRDLRLRAMERRLVEEIERARRTESEIWEVELRARDQRVAVLTREIEKSRSSESDGGREGADTSALRDALQGRDREVADLRGVLEQVRAGLSAILVDGRGAVIAHDLVTILRQLEEPGDTAS